MQAKLSIWTQYYNGMSPEEAVDAFLRNSIKCAELSDEHGAELLKRDEDYIKTGKEFAIFLKERNFEISQGHLWLGCKICTDENAVEILCKWIDLYEAIGIKNMVLHCDEMGNTNLSDKQKLDANVEKLKIVAEHIKDKDITICLENLILITPNVDDLLYIIESLGSDKFGICLDTGHLNLTVKNQREFIMKAKDKLKALHIADNQGKFDEHLMPYTRGTVDFEEVVKALKEVDYKGVFNLEIPGESTIPNELRDAKIKFIIASYNYLMR